MVSRETGHYDVFEETVHMLSQKRDFILDAKTSCRYFTAWGFAETDSYWSPVLDAYGVCHSK